MPLQGGPVLRATGADRGRTAADAAIERGGGGGGGSDKYEHAHLGDWGVKDEAAAAGAERGRTAGHMKRYITARTTAARAGGR